MAITLELTCTCGASLSYEGARRGEREAKAEWASEHGEHGVPAAEPTPEPDPAPEPEAPKVSRRQQREAVAG